MFFVFAGREYNLGGMEELLQKLVRAKTTADKGELAAAQIICEELGASGIDCRIDVWEENRANVAAEVKSSRNRPGLLFVSHLDVVEAGPSGEEGWSYRPFEAVKKDGRIWGRGAADMKGGIAAVVTAIREVHESGAQLEGDLLFVGAAGEETDSCGAKRFMEEFGKSGRKVCGVVLTEPTDFEVVTAHRGMLWLKVKTKGRAAHGSSPQLGVNAIWSMKRVLDELERYKIKSAVHKVLGGCSMSVNTISGGKEINVVPDECEIKIDIRTVPAQDTVKIIGDFERILVRLREQNPNFTAEVSIVRQVGALETDAECDFVRKFTAVVGVERTKAVGFTTDGPHFVQLGAPIVIFGPGKSEVCHKTDEYIDIADVKKGVEYYKSIIMRFCG
jgi:succinyl-diaminopimelate desuccinylase